VQSADELPLTRCCVASQYPAGVLGGSQEPVLVETPRMFVSQGRLRAGIVMTGGARKVWCRRCEAGKKIFAKYSARPIMVATRRCCLRTPRPNPSDARRRNLFVWLWGSCRPCIEPQNRRRLHVRRQCRHRGYLHSFRLAPLRGDQSRSVNPSSGPSEERRTVAVQPDKTASSRLPGSPCPRGNRGPPRLFNPTVSRCRPAYVPATQSML